MRSCSFPEQGKLDIDADVNTYLENFQIEDTYPGQPVTLRHCLTHTPGFEDGALGYLIIDNEANVIPLADAMAKYQPARVNPPGKIGAYSNYCTALSGLIVANVSGIPFEEYVYRNIFQPLGMRSSSFSEPLPEGLDENMTVAYKYEAGRYVARPFELVGNFGPAGGLSATMTDLLKFGGALLNGGEYNGGRILQPETLEEMKKIAFTYDDRVKGIGLGFLQYPYGDTDTFGHDGGTTAFFSHFGVTPSADLVIAFSFSGPGGGKTYATLTRAIYEQFLPKAEFDDEPPADFDGRAGKYAGTYTTWRRSFTKLESLMALFGQVNVVPNGEGELMIGESRFVEIDNHLFRNVENGDLVAFQQDDSGEISGFVQDGWPIQSMYKVSTAAKRDLTLPLVIASVLILLLVVLRNWYQRASISELPSPDKGATRTALWTAVAHLLVLIVGAITLVAVGDQLMNRIPTMVTAWLWIPIIAVLLSLFLAWKMVQVWMSGAFSGVLARVRYSLIALAALYLSWAYYYWNILGFNYY